MANINKNLLLETLANHIELWAETGHHEVAQVLSEWAQQIEDGLFDEKESQ